MRKLASMLAVAALALAGAAAAGAAPGGTNPTPPAACNSGHGAFGYFGPQYGQFAPGDGLPPYFGDSTLGSARAGLTGANNSGYSASCNA